MIDGPCLWGDGACGGDGVYAMIAGAPASHRLCRDHWRLWYVIAENRERRHRNALRDAGGFVVAATEIEFVRGEDGRFVAREYAVDPAVIAAKLAIEPLLDEVPASFPRTRFVGFAPWLREESE